MLSRVKSLRAAASIVLLLVLFASVLTVFAQSVTVTTTARVRLRTEPNVSSRTIVVIPFNTAVTARAVNAAQTWILVEYNGSVGWISARFATVSSGDLDLLPTRESGGSSASGTSSGTAAPRSTGTPRAANPRGATSTPSPVTVSLEAVPEVAITGQPDATAPGGCVRVNWTVTGELSSLEAIILSTNGAEDNVEPSGSSRVCINETTTFTLSVPARGASRSVTVRVVAP
ncbi:MAG: SH3 domain-containing protein [bacterium]|nr:SH3 domain-containing protein [bacterium]